MTTSPTAFLHEITNYQRIPVGKLAYFRARLQDRIYNLVVSAFLRKEASDLMTRSDLAARLHKDPAQITRYLASPGNWTLDTVSDLLLGVCAAELAVGIDPLANVVRLDKTAPTRDSARIVTVDQDKPKTVRTNQTAKMDLFEAA